MTDSISTSSSITDNMYFSDNYKGPGVYRHYKGGIYIVFGLCRLEWSNRQGVIYMTLDRDHARDNWYKGMFGVVRPLNKEDGDDAFNLLVMHEPEPDQFEVTIAAVAPILSDQQIAESRLVPRFELVTASA